MKPENSKPMNPPSKPSPAGQAPQSRFWHVSNGQLWTGGTETTFAAYKARLRKAYGSLRGIKIIQATSEELAYNLAFFGMGTVKMTRREDGIFKGFAIVRRAQ